jgi:two-component system, chemotaxis family, chemotaxis protein CheY
LVAKFVDPSIPRPPTVVASAGKVEPKRILVIDDESGVRQLLTDLLAGEGYVVSQAPDGIRGLECLREVSPDLIILDLMMPVVTGWAFAQACRRMDMYNDVPIIAISAMFDLNGTAATQDAPGVRAYVAKPFDVESLLALVAQLV